MSFLYMLLSIGCLPEFEVRKFPEDPLTDFDGDGYTVDDCDDENPDVYPGADELCDFIDNNCNGSIDELAIDAQLWYADMDADGFGLEQYVIEACTIPDNYAPARFDPDGNPLFDCDDDPVNGQGASVNPLAQETCTLFDDNCNGLINENDPLMNEALIPSWYLDRDFDGYGGDFEQDVITACTQPSLDYRLSGGDCDDLNPYVNPIATERCDQVDNDCNGLIDEGDPDVLIDAYWYPDNDGDGFGTNDPTVAFIAACEQPEGHVLPNTDCNDNNPGISPEGYEICDGFDNDCDGIVDDGVTNMYFLDVDGDGYGRRFDTDGDGIVDDFDNDGNPDNFVEACEAPVDPASGNDYVGNFDDCDDNNSSVNPAAQETCDGIDNNCNGLTDGTDVGSNGTSWYLDADGDGYGSAQVFNSCTQPLGYVGNSEDCDDTRAAVNPSSQESCLTIYDDNCDYTSSLSTDIEFTNDIGAIGCIDYFEDRDGDGFGAGTGQCTCLPDPEGVFVSPLNTDCDDQKPYVNPGQIENCYTPQDDNCNGSMNDSGAIYCSNFFFDNDLDGFGVTGDSVCTCIPTGLYSAPGDGDCLDTNFYIHPNADEECDGLDNNCDGVTDLADAVDAHTWYIDQDQDGYGSPDVIQNSLVQNPIVQCFSPGTQYLLNDLDCNDQVASINPGVSETCNTVYDDDCDGSVNMEDAVGCLDVYQDLDADGFGNTVSICTCAVTTDYPTFESGDCDDTDQTIAPDVEEVCDGFYDENCDGRVDEADAIGCVNYFLDTDGDGEGTGFPSCLCAPTTLYSVQVTGDCDDGDAFVNRASNNCAINQTLTTSSAVYVVDSSMMIEFTEMVDVNSDGFDDLIVGLPTDDEMGSISGAVEIFLSPFPAVLSTGSQGTSDIRFTAGQSTPNTQIGINVLVGDFDGDAQNSVDTIIMGGTQYTILTNGLSLGAVSLDSVGTQRQQDLSKYQTAMVVGDVDGDGFDNVVVTANGVSELWDGNINYSTMGLIQDEVMSFVILNTVRDWDVNNDGYVDLLVSDGTQEGIIFGGTGVYSSMDVVWSEEGASMTITDVNGDGSADWALKNPHYSPQVVESGRGTFDAVDLGLVALMSYQNQMVTTLSTIVGEFHAGLAQSSSYSVPQSQFGMTVYPIGDFNGDGLSDLVIQNGHEVDYSGTTNCTQNWSVLYGGGLQSYTASSLDGILTNDSISATDCVSTLTEFHFGVSNAYSSSSVLMTVNPQAGVASGWYTGVIMVSEQ